ARRSSGLGTPPASPWEVVSAILSSAFSRCVSTSPGDAPVAGALRISGWSTWPRHFEPSGDHDLFPRPPAPGPQPHPPDGLTVPSARDFFPTLCNIAGHSPPTHVLH